MKMFVDARCLQDSAYAKRGIGRHAASVLRHAKRFLPVPLEIIGLLDPSLGELSSEHGACFDGFQNHATPPHPSEGQALFFQPSPMTHPADRIAPFLCRDFILSCEIFYDLVPLDDPSFYLNGIGARQAYLGNLVWLKHYRLHAPISEHAKKCVTDLAGPNEWSIAVTGACLGKAFAQFDPATVSQIPKCSRFASGDYFIMVGGEDPRKNTDKVLAAQAKLLERGMRTRIMVVGLYAECVTERLLKQHRDLGGNNRDIQFIYGVKDEELTALYHHAKACICPSKNEGFSLPIVEAMACKVPVLAARSAAQAELVEQPEALFDPNDIEALANLMKRVVEEPELSSTLVERQSRVASRYVEEDVAARVWMLVRRRLTPPVQIRATKKLSRPRLAFLSPYPSREEKKLGYAPTLLRSLSAAADITVFSDENKPRQDPWINDFQPLSALAYLSGEYDRIVNVLGLGADNRGYFWLAERFGGACLLCSPHLGPFYANQLGLPRAVALAKRSLGRDVKIAEMKAWLENLFESGTRFLDEVSSWADPLIVQSRLAQRDVSGQVNGDVAFLPPCFVNVVDECDLTIERRRDARERLGLVGERVRILVAGSPITSASAPLTVQSLELLRSWGIDAELLFVGVSNQSLWKGIERTAQRCNLAEFVHHFHWPLDAAGWRTHLQVADLGLCLSTTVAVETPVELFEMLGAGVPTVVNRELAQGFELPPLAMEVPDVPSALLIAEQWLSAIQSGRHLDRLTSERQRFIEERSPDRHARTMLHMLKVA